ncbi:MAG: hypothetical protein D6820_06520 [Lentisphaerae bacterium]|nr:MAG: hypothetical protein D6820_06520 [Lentisphaerota bacterium]
MRLESRKEIRKIANPICSVTLLKMTLMKAIVIERLKYDSAGREYKETLAAMKFSASALVGEMEGRYALGNVWSRLG